MRNLGFKLKCMEDGTIRGILSLKEEEPPTTPIEEKVKVQETITTIEKAADKGAEAEKQRQAKLWSSTFYALN